MCHISSTTQSEICSQQNEQKEDIKSNNDISELINISLLSFMKRLVFVIFEIKFKPSSFIFFVLKITKFLFL